MDLATELAGVKFPRSIINAAGAKDVSLDDLRALGQSAAGAIVIKTATAEFRAGNDRPRYFTNELGSVNSSGLPNLGYQRYAESMPELKKHDKPVIASLSGMGEGDNEKMIAAYTKAGVDMIEVNLSCPNLAGKGQMGYDPKATKKMMASCRKETDLPMGVKLPPYFDNYQYEQIGEALGGNVDFIVTINSPGNTLIIDVEKEQKVISPNNGLAGLGGRYVKPIALANVHKWFQLVGDKVPIIGVGGVQTGTDAFEHLLAGASAVGVGTAVVNEGPGVFDRLNQELSDVLGKHGYDSPSAARGKLKDLPAA